MEEMQQKQKERETIFSQTTAYSDRSISDVCYFNSTAPPRDVLRVWDPWQLTDIPAEGTEAAAVQQSGCQVP